MSVGLAFIFHLLFGSPIPYRSPLNILVKIKTKQIRVLRQAEEIVLFSCITAILFCGGYNMPELFVNETFVNIQAVVLGIKTCIFCFVFVWLRATLPRLRYDQLVELCWLNLLPIVVAVIILVPSILIAFDMSPLQATCCLISLPARSKLIKKN